MTESSHLRILLVNQYYPPDAAATALVFRDLVDSLANAGHEVTVVCGRPSYRPTEKRRWRLIQNEKHGPTRIKRMGSSAFDRRRILGRALNYLSYLGLSAVLVLLRRRPDIVLVGSDPPFAVWVALLAARGQPVLYSVRDLHPDFAIASGMIRPGFLAQTWERLHLMALKRCSLVVCLGEAMADRIREKGILAERIAVVYDGAPSPTGRPDPKVVAEIRGHRRFTVAHCGNVGGAGAWDTLIEAASRLNGGAEFLFVGDGFQAGRISGAGIRLVPFQPASELGSVMASGDLQVVSLRRGLEGLAVPSKLYTAIAHGRPVLAVAAERSEVAQIVHEWGCGLVADPDDPDDIVKKVEWAQSHPEALTEMSRRAFEAARYFDRPGQLRRFVHLVEEVATGALSKGG